MPADIVMSAPPPGSALHRLQGISMGTTWSVAVAAPPHAVEGLQGTIEQALAEVVRQMSHWEPDSDLMRYNRADAGSHHALPPAFWTVLNTAIQVARLSDGAYDPAAGALVDVWGFGATGRHDEAGFQPPDATMIESLTKQPGRKGWRDIVLMPETRQALQPGGVRLDLSAVAKGYAVDLVSQSLAAQGVRHHLVEVGGELRGQGMKPDLHPWWVELEWPAEMAAQPPLMALHGLSVATSGDYRKLFEHEGRRYPHTIDPRTGWPLTHGLASVTVVHASCMMADALSTALNVLGLQEGLAFAQRQGLAACFVQREGDGLAMHMSTAFEAMLQ